MGKNPVKDLVLVPPEEIEREDRAFAVSPPWSACPPSLVASVVEVGVLNPLRLQSLGGSFRVVCGFRRLAAALSGGLKEVPALIEEGREERELFQIALADNLGTRPLSPLEAATALYKLKEQHGISVERLVKDFLPRFGLKPSLYALETHLDLARLRERLQQAVDLGGLLQESAFRISGWSNDEQEFFISLVETYHLGRNKQRQILDLLFDLRRALQKEVRVIWAESGAEQVTREENLPPDQVFDRTRAALRKLRFPQLSSYEERYESLKSGLALPVQVSFQMPPDFEGDRVRTVFEAKSADEFRAVVTGLKRSAEAEQLDRIFELL